MSKTLIAVIALLGVCAIAATAVGLSHLDKRDPLEGSWRITAVEQPPFPKITQSGLRSGYRFSNGNADRIIFSEYSSRITSSEQLGTYTVQDNTIIIRNTSFSNGQIRTGKAEIPFEVSENELKLVIDGQIQYFTRVKQE